jgi:hypothetical protein
MSGSLPSLPQLKHRDNFILLFMLHECVPKLNPEVTSHIVVDIRNMKEDVNNLCSYGTRRLSTTNTIALHWILF